MTNYRTTANYTGQEFNGILIGEIIRMRPQIRYRTKCLICGSEGYVDHSDVSMNNTVRLRCLNNSCYLFGTAKPPVRPDESDSEKPSAVWRREQEASAKEKAGEKAQALAAEALDRDNYRHYYFIEALWLQKPLVDVLTLEQWKQLPQDIRNRLTVESRKWKRVSLPNSGFAYERREA